MAKLQKQKINNETEPLIKILLGKKSKDRWFTTEFY